VDCQRGKGPPPPDFQGPAGALRTPRRPGRSASHSTLSPSESIPGLSMLTRDHPFILFPVKRKKQKNDRWTVKEGREPSPGPPSASLGSFTSPWCVLQIKAHAPPSRSGNLDPVPFRWRARRPLNITPCEIIPEGGPPSPTNCRKQPLW